jgi:hypothetical protein
MLASRLIVYLLLLWSVSVLKVSRTLHETDIGILLQDKYSRLFRVRVLYMLLGYKLEALSRKKGSIATIVVFGRRWRELIGDRRTSLRTCRV